MKMKKKRIREILKRNMVFIGKHIKYNYYLYLFCFLILLGWGGVFYLVWTYKLSFVFSLIICLCGLIIFGKFMMEEKGEGFSHLYFSFLLIFIVSLGVIFLIMEETSNG